jgi:hypothetical protein
MNLSFQRVCLGVRIMHHFIMLERPISSRPTFLWMDQLDCSLKRDCRINFLWARSVKSFSCPLRGISLYRKCESEMATSGWQGLQSTETFSHHCKACHSNCNIFTHILPSLYSFLTLLTVLRVLLTFRVSYVSGVLANIMTESSPLLLEMWQKLRTQISKIQRDCIMVCIILLANHYTKWFWKT